MPTTPDRPPEAELLRRYRLVQRLTIREAAQRAGVSDARWRQVEAGYETVRTGVRVPAVAKPETLAHMAYAVALPADRLESEGQRPDAAAILREIARQKEADVPDRATPRTRTAPAIEALAAKAADYLEVVELERARNLPPRDENEARIWATEELSERERAIVIATWRMALARETARRLERHDTGLRQAAKNDRSRN